MSLSISKIMPVDPEQSPEQIKLKKACQEMEAIFLRYLLQKMRDTVPKDGLIPTSSAQDIFTEMMDSAMADNISERGVLGLAEMLYQQMFTHVSGSQAGDAADDSTAQETQEG